MPNIGIFIVSPSRYIFSRCFDETALLLKYSLEELGYNVFFNQWIADSYSTIVLGANIPYKIVQVEEFKLNKNCIIYQLEQISEHSPWYNEKYKKILQSAGDIWDYSKTNIDKLKRDGFQSVKHLPIGYHKKLESIEPKDKEFDVFFYGSISERRKKILDELSKKLNILTGFGVFGFIRDDIIARSKIILNIHQRDEKILEGARISYLLNNKCFIISEDSLLEDKEFYKEQLVFVDYEKIVETCLNYASHEIERERIVNAGYEKFKEKRMVDYLRSVLQPFNPY